MIVLDLSILNQKGTPMFYSDIFANRPTFGIVGRIFISIDTAAIYRDTGTAWDLIADGGSTSTNIYNSNGTLSANRVVSDGGFSLTFNPSTTFDTTLTAANNASSLSIFGVNRLSYAAGFSANNIGAIYGGTSAFALQTFAGSATFAQANVASGGASVNSIDFSSAGSTITMTQSSGIRVMTGQQNLFQYQGTNSGTITHAAISQNTGFYRPSGASGILTITNAYSHLINALDDYGAGFTFTNRWGIYQAGASDINYFAANVLINTLTNSGEKLRVNGNVLIESKITANDSLLNTSYTGGGTAIIETWQRIGGAVAANMVYDDANTNMNFGTSTSHDFNIKTSNTSRITIKSTGPVGIGVTNPLATLHIGNSGATNLYIQSGSGSDSILRYFVGSNECVTARSDSSANYRIETGIGSPTEKLRITGSTGNLLVGTSVDNGSRMQISGAATITSSVTAFSFITAGFAVPTSVVGLFNNTNYGGPAWNNASFVTGNGATGIMAGGDAGIYAYGWIQGVQTDTGGIKGIYVNPLGANFHILPNGGGNCIINSTSNPGQRLYLNGSLRIDGQSSGTAGGSSGQHLIINLDGTTYKIALLNP